MRSAFAALAILGTILAVTIPASAGNIESVAPGRLSQVCTSGKLANGIALASTISLADARTPSPTIAKAVDTDDVAVTSICVSPPHDDCIGSWTYYPNNRTNPDDDEFYCTGVHSYNGKIDCVGIYARHSDGSEYCTGV